MHACMSTQLGSYRRAALCATVNRPREQAKDSEVFCTLAASGVEQAKKLAAGAKVCCASEHSGLYTSTVTLYCSMHLPCPSYLFVKQDS